MPFVLFIPYFPTGIGLQQKHFQSVFYSGSSMGAFFQKKSRFGILNQVISQMKRGNV